MKITVDLAPAGEIGTVATVKERRWFKSVFTTYICVGTSPLMGGRWINTARDGQPPSTQLQCALNEAAQQEALRRT